MSTDDDIAAWDAEADAFDEAADHGLHDPAVRRAWADLLLPRLPGPPARVADLGCGTGTLSLLLADAGHAIDGVDFSGRMVERATAKASGRPGVAFVVGDAAEPPLADGGYDVVLCRHVLWAMPDPAAALRRWLRLLTPDGRLLLVEGRWSTGAGLTAERTVDLVRATGRTAELVPLPDPALWGRAIEDERYLVESPSAARS